MAQMPDYAYYYHQANAYFGKGELTKAIEMYEKALPLAEGESLPVAQNNLAAIYMRRGNYMLSDQKQPGNALSDYRRAYYLLEYAWPEGMDRSTQQEANRKIARENMQIGYSNLNINTQDKNWHLEAARRLRAEGKFQEAVVEYARVHELDTGNTDVLKALGDLFNVLNRPEKSKKYYGMASENLGPRADDELLVRLANSQNKAGEVDNAVASLNKALELNPNNHDALKQLEDIWVRDLRFNPNSVLGHANLASVYQKKKMYVEALREYNAAEHLASRDPKVTLDVKKLIRLNMGTLYQEQGNHEMAIKAYDTVLQIDPGHKLATYYKATLLRDTGRVNEAIAQYNRLLSLDPDSEDAHGDLLKLIQRQPSQAQVIAGLKDYAGRYPSNALVQSKVGEEFHALKMYDEAISYYLKALAVKPDMAAAHANLGAAYAAKDSPMQALEHFRKAQALDPNNETVKKLSEETELAVGGEAYRKAVELQQQGDNEGAVRQYEEALKIAANDSPELRASYGVALQSLNRIPEAIAQYQKAIAAAPDNGDFQYYLATAYHQQNKLGDAELAYQKALRSASISDEARGQSEEAVKSIHEAQASEVLTQVVTAYEAKNHVQALSLVDKALKLDPGNAMAYYYQALVYTDQNKVQQSIDSYNRVIQNDPSFKDAYFGLGVALDKKQDKSAAKSAFQKFLELSNGQDDDFVKYARERANAL